MQHYQQIGIIARHDNPLAHLNDFCSKGAARGVVRIDIWNHSVRRLIILSLLILSSCGRQPEDPVVTQMRVRAMQTRTFVGHNAKKVTREMLTVLQDQGYMVKSVSHDIGILTAELDTNIGSFSSKFWAYLFSGKNARWKKHSVIELTSNINEENGNTKIRINYLVRVFDNLGRVVDVHQILEDEAYLEFFNKIQKGLLSS